MKILFVAQNQIRLISKNTVILALFTLAPVFLIFLFGQAFEEIFASAEGGTGAGIRALDYFGITLLNLVVIQGTSLAAWAFFKEKRFNTEIRLFLAPLSRWELLSGIFLGTLISLLSISFLILLLLRLILSVEYGSAYGLILLLLTGETLLASSLGFSLGVLLGQEKTANALISTFVPLLALLGGSYFIIPERGVLNTLSYVSPLRWINLAMLDAASNTPSCQYLGKALLFCFILSFLFLLSAGLKTGRQK